MGWWFENCVCLKHKQREGDVLCVSRALERDSEMNGNMKWSQRDHEYFVSYFLLAWSCVQGSGSYFLTLFDPVILGHVSGLIIV